ncbi:class I adenylate-forming enzyme family protein [Sulfurisphaera ohwakuensis]|uniref:AMP-binding protein n=1 Tax=Sulfurisphaera ohwakuensis TaxID=69656 RepID=A0A650CH29_SULOH|nr:class I adenylate-forming enzyme family protein [Sulfurisphaera ohwakuensis]MBB5252447.1 long-chain acyl-CoA synthetase [Sulfurisphaera ohwakuensis]QGR17100.1 AMP-binding protein [Sulfurisphaera ohwakuensis]
MSLARLVYEWSKKTPSKTFLISEDKNLTYEQAVQEIAKIASNISPGSTVVHIMFNTVESILAYLAILWAGGKIVAVDPLTSAEDLKFILEDSKPDLVFTDHDVYEREKNILKDYKTVVEVPRKNVFSSPYEYREDEVGLIYYYAGIAGRTMQVLHSAERMELNSLSLYRATKLKEVKSILTVPIAHVLGNSVLGVTLEAGGAMYIVKKFEPKSVASVIEKYSINYLSTVPMVYDSLNTIDANLSSLELCVSSAAPLFPNTVNTFFNKFGKKIVQQYGFTEGFVLTFQPLEYADVISVGKPLPEVEVKIVKDDGKEAKTGEVGELWVKAPWLMLGYKDIEETNKVFSNGWLKTGDLMSMDDKGLLYFRGIKKRMLKYKGYPIFPRDLEEILKTHPNVIDAKVIGEDAGQLGQQPIAMVVVKEKKDGIEEELLNYVNTKVAFYKKLKKVYIVDKIE